MLNISRNELENLEKVGSGKFGTVYRNGNYAYKIYFDKITSTLGNLYKNPCLKLNRLKMNRLISVDKKLDNIDLVKDIIFIDNKFAGVKLAYHKGETLNKYSNSSLEEKKKIASMMINDSKKLTKKFIYPTDYKLDNAIYDGSNFTFIDLDDIKTKVNFCFNPKLYIETVKGLDETIKTFFGEYNFLINKLNEYKDYLSREVDPLNKSYRKIEEYVNNYKGIENAIFIDNSYVIDNSNIDLLRNRKYKVIYVTTRPVNSSIILMDNTNLIYVKKLLSLGIDVYDAIERCFIDKYIESFNIEDAYKIEENKILKLK